MKVDSTCYKFQYISQNKITRAIYQHQLVNLVSQYKLVYSSETNQLLIYVWNNSQWKQVSSAYIYDNGQWKQIQSFTVYQ